MATTSNSPQAQARITVYASLPRSVPVEHASVANIDLHPSNWEWVPCLSLPVPKLNALHLSQRPYKWIKYAIGIVIGAHGDLSTQSESNNIQIVDYNTVLPTNSTDLYYHTSNEEKKMMFPLDPDILHTSITSSATSYRGAFWVEVAARDGQKCIWTGIGARFCDAVHLVSSNKTDQYISNITHHRGRGNKGNTITEIDNAQNGLLLNRLSLVLFGQELAFLKTPNFAMKSDDIDETAEPDKRMYTAHIIQHDENQCVPPDLVPGSQLKIPDPVSPQFPPDILFDVAYAGMVLCHFGTERMRDGITMKWKHLFYSNGPTTSANQMARKERQAQEHKAHHDHHTGAHHNTFDNFDLLAIPYLLVPPEELQAMVRAAEQRAEAAEQKHVRDRVEEWSRQINATEFS